MKIVATANLRSCRGRPLVAQRRNTLDIDVWLKIKGYVAAGRGTVQSPTESVLFTEFEILTHLPGELFIIKIAADRVVVNGRCQFRFETIPGAESIVQVLV